MKRVRKRTSSKRVYYYTKRHRVYVTPKRRVVRTPRVEETTIMGLHKATARDVCYIIIFMLIGVGVINTVARNLGYVSEHTVPVARAQTIEVGLIDLPTPIPTPTPSPTPFIPITQDPSTQQIINYIKQVFGKDAPKAFLLLANPNPNVCHENGSFDPNKVNTYGNYPPGSRDIGVFQINEYWQGVQAKFLLNWKINVQIAKQLFDENGGHFNLWTCGKEQGL